MRTNQQLSFLKKNFTRLSSGAKARITVLLIALLGIAGDAASQVAANWQVGTWSQFKTAAVSYTMDDNCSNQIPVALPLFDQYGFKVTFYAVVNWGPNWTALANASNNGHEVGSHTMSHPNSLATLSIANQETELGQSQSTINSKIPNAKCLTVAYPNCNIGNLATIQKYYIAGRICSNSIVSSTPSDFYNISSLIAGSTGNIKTATDFNGRVDAAKNSKGWAVFLIHGIDNDGGYSPTQSSELKTHLGYVNQNKSSFWVGTFLNVVKYIKERNAAKLTETTISADSLQITVTDNLDNTIYNFPITVRRVVPSAWQTPRVYIGGKLATSTVVTENGTRYVMFDVVPDQGNVYLGSGKVTSAPAAPGVVSPVTYCQNATASALTASGTSLKWYTVSSGGSASTNAPVPSTATAGTTNYYVSQTVNGVESTRAMIAVVVNAAPSAPSVSASVTYCQNAAATPLSASGSNLKWYTASSGGSGNTIAPTPSTSAAGVTNYYVSQTSNGCESQRAQIAVTVNALPGSPSVTSPVVYCQNAAATPLTASGTNLKWYTVSSGGNAGTTAPTPSTASAGTVNYYVSQTTSGCESPRAQLTVTVNALPGSPSVTSPVVYCQNASASALTASGSTLKWYSSSSGGSGSSIAPIPSTASAGTTLYYVSQTQNGCEGQKASITVTVNSIPDAPSVASPVTYCQNETASALTAVGASLTWYAASSGGNGSATAPVPSTAAAGTFNFYVTQTSAGCESARQVIAVQVNALPEAVITPDGPVSFVEGGNVVLQANTGTGLNYKWMNGASALGNGTSYTATASGNYSVEVANANGCKKTSAAVQVTVSPNQASVVTILSPASNATVSGDVTINALVSDPDGTVTLVEFLDGTTVIGSVTQEPYTYVWNNPALGNHSITLRVKDSNGGITNSSSVEIQIESPTAISASAALENNSRIYPNPVAEELFVESSIDLSAASFKVVDAFGVERGIVVQPTATGVSAEVHDLPAGTYILLIENEGAFARKKITVVR